MADPKNTAGQRLTQIKDFLTMNKTATTIPWDPDCTKFPRSCLKFQVRQRKQLGFGATTTM
jgi:hypothetical protein